MIESITSTISAMDFSAVKLVEYLDLLGVFFNAILGGVIARAARLDFVGYLVMATLSGLGGGVIRDILIQAGPPNALVDIRYLITALVGVTLAYFIRVEGKLWDRVFPPIDAIALGSWAAAGTQKALNLDFHWLPALLLGTITAVGGGFVRDMVLGRVPAVLGGNKLYATCAMAAAAVMIGFDHYGHPSWGLLASLSTGATFCYLARQQDWALPLGDDVAFARALRKPALFSSLSARRRKAPESGTSGP